MRRFADKPQKSQRREKPDALERFAERAERSARAQWFDGPDRESYTEACEELRRVGEEAQRPRIAEMPILICLYGPAPRQRRRKREEG